MSAMMGESCEDENDGGPLFSGSEFPFEDGSGMSQKGSETHLLPQVPTTSPVQHGKNDAIESYCESASNNSNAGFVERDGATTEAVFVNDYHLKDAKDVAYNQQNEVPEDSIEEGDGSDNSAAALSNEENPEDAMEDALIIETHQLAEEEFENFGENDDAIIDMNHSETEEILPIASQDSPAPEIDVHNQQSLDPLPDCRNKRSYVCGFCNMKTNNPREYLYHLKDVHTENIKIFECSQCIYASKTQQKLVRHNHMVHKLSIISKAPEQKKKPKEKTFKPSHNKKMKPFPISRSPRESKSPRRFEEYEYLDDSELDYEEPSPPSNKGSSGKTLYNCDQCSFSCNSSKVLGKHENKYHLKRRFYKCTRCNYATQVKARYTKHLKYHQLPIIKCEWCDFRTPYRWNLDRHNKNHTEEAGEHKCHLCNFSATIKQSLTVHVANHHLTPEQIKERESKRTIGICDPEDCIADEEMELLRMERDEDPDALELPEPSSVTPSNHSFTVSNIDVGNQEEFDTSLNENESHVGLEEPKRKKPKIKITLKKMKGQKDTFFQELNERHNFDEDFIHPDDVVQRHGNVYIKTEKCSLCPFKAPFQHEILRHQKKAHSLHVPKGIETLKKVKKTKSLDKFETSESSSDSTSENMKRRFSLSSSFNSTDINDISDTGEEKSLNIPKVNLESLINKEEEPMYSDCLKCDEPSTKDALPTKKKSSFFDKLQEKLSSSNVQNLVCQFCGHESKCLSESVRHQKLHLSVKNVYATPSLSTRCQFCRHRCKTTDDLMNHLKSCPEARKNQIIDSMNVDANEDASNKKLASKNKGNGNINDEDRHSTEIDTRHPMENKVFVWNNISNFSEDDPSISVNEAAEEMSLPGGSHSPSESVFSIPDSDLLDEGPNEIEGFQPYKIVKKKVYRCPQCNFWSTTASRFHVHIVGHYNTKPYGCSECGYRSNWRWDITKHIKLKVAKDKNHREAQVCLADESGEKNYEKYEKYLVEVRVDEIYANRPEGGISLPRRGRPKRNPENDNNETDSAKSSPCPTPLTFPSVPASTTTPSASKIPAPPKLMRAPNRQFNSSPGPTPFGPINLAAQMMVEPGNANSSEGDAAKKKFAIKPPPLVAMGALAQQHHQHQPQLPQQSQPRSQPQIQQHERSPSLPSTKEDIFKAGSEIRSEGGTASGSNYQIITPQGALSTSLETLQLLAAGSTNLAKLKRQQKETGEGKNPELDAAVANQENEVGASSSTTTTSNTNNTPPLSSIMQLIRDHEGNPEWKCLTCDFRDNEQETVVQHVRLAHSKKGPVSLLHAVHRCSVCGFAAGTKRHVQVHLETAHNGQGGIISRSEGQNIDTEGGNDEANRSFDCRLCPFQCKKRGELKAHLSHHTPRVDYVFKCMFCPYYVATKNDLFHHLNVHGMEIPASGKETVATNPTSVPPGAPSQTDDQSSRHFVCDLCPFETRSRAKLMHHRQFHRPRGLAFSCPHCSYNVTRRHLLAQHLRIHGVSPTEGLEAAENTGNKPALSKIFQEEPPPFSRSKSPSPSLTITPINGGKPALDGDTAPPKIDPDCLPTLSDELTKNLHDIPLVWVSRDGRFFKMFKCRHCPHVNLRKTNIQEHEKMHRSEGLAPGTGHSCQFCSYICINAGVMSAHLKVHNGSIGKCHAIVDQALPNEEQLHMLAGSAMRKAEAEKMVKKGDEKLLYYCQHCPARFFFEKEVQIHSRFHMSNANFTHHCPKCNFGARDESQILAHDKIHTPEYQERTRTLKSMHPSAPSFPPVPGLSVPPETTKSAFGVSSPENQDMAPSRSTPVNGFSRPWLTTPPPSVAPNSGGRGNLPQPPPTSRFKCDQCPSTFSKLVTLQYHQSLHSADNPFRCNRCTYAAKTQDGLQQHLSLHEQADLEKSSTGSFLSSSPSPIASPVPMGVSKKPFEQTLGSLTGPKMKKGLMASFPESMDHPPIKLKFIGLKGASSSGSSKKQFKYYIEEQVPLSGVELLKRKNQIEREMPKDAFKEKKTDGGITSKSPRQPKQDDRTGNPKLHYPLHIDKSSGRSREKRYKCVKCPSAFEKLDQFNVHLNLHGSNYKYKCRICDYSVKFYANFMMHIKRHKYHEKMDAQKKGLPLPLEEQVKYEPNIGENVAPVDDTREKDDLLGDKENQLDLDSYPDMTTAEKQQLILQHKKADAFKPKEDDKDKKVFYCQYCPYANMRRDAVDSHSLRHQANMGRGLYQCNFCDYTASQPNFIREHTRVHFRPFKFVQPEGFMRHDKVEIWSIKSGESTEDDDMPKKCLVFTYDETAMSNPIKPESDVQTESGSDTKSENHFTPLSPKMESDPVDSQAESGILVDFRSGDVVEAPSNFIIPLRPTKSKSSLSNSSTLITTGKHKSSKTFRARKKTKLESPTTISPELPIPVQSDENEDNGVNSTSVSPRATLTNQESGAFTLPTSLSSPNALNGDITHECKGDEYHPIENVSSLKENFNSATAVSN